MTTLFLTSTENWGFFSCMASPSSLNILSRWSAPPLSPTTHAFSQHRRHMRSHRTYDSTNHRRSSYKFKFNTLSLTNFRSEKQCISREKKKTQIREGFRHSRSNANLLSPVSTGKVSLSKPKT
ncbi:hypothetical protein AAZV13_04G084800 [Glycine max]|nr:hypothetical protein GmHk_04G009918 [Glycine max]